jgi:hypothetical protein
VRRRRIVLVIIILKDGFPEAEFVWDACCLTLDEPLEEGGSDAIGHDVRWPQESARDGERVRMVDVLWTAVLRT